MWSPFLSHFDLSHSFLLLVLSVCRQFFGSSSCGCDASNRAAHSRLWTEKWNMVILHYFIRLIWNCGRWTHATSHAIPFFTMIIALDRQIVRHTYIRHTHTHAEHALVAHRSLLMSRVSDRETAYARAFIVFHFIPNTSLFGIFFFFFFFVVVIWQFRSTSIRSIYH